MIESIPLVSVIPFITLIGSCVYFIARMEQLVKDNKLFSEEQVNNIQTSLDNTKVDLKELIEKNNEHQKELLKNTKEELKEDIERLEKKQEESNKVKERLATSESHIKLILSWLGKVA